MTFAPENLKAARRLLLEHLDIHENSTAYPTDLDPAEVGIVGDPNHRGGYHCGRDRVDDDDYSVRESSRDRTGLTEAACALDIGSWSLRVGGKSHDLRSMSVWLVAQCKAGTSDTKDIREIIYSPDGTVVKRWDRLGKRNSGDSSHRWHTHISYHRDAIKAGRDQTAVFRRYLTTIGVLEDDVTKSEFMEWFDEAMRQGIRWTSPSVRDYAVDVEAVKVVNGEPVEMTPWGFDQYTWYAVHSKLPAILAVLAEVKANQQAMAGQDWVNEEQIVDGVLAGLGSKDLDTAAAALVAAFGDRAAELAAKLAAATAQG